MLLWWLAGRKMGRGFQCGNLRLCCWGTTAERAVEVSGQPLHGCHVTDVGSLFKGPDK